MYLMVFLGFQNLS